MLDLVRLRLAVVRTTGLRNPAVAATVAALRQAADDLRRGLS